MEPCEVNIYILPLSGKVIVQPVGTVESEVHALETFEELDQLFFDLRLSFGRDAIFNTTVAK
jgi:hypothetical protein